jgi:hypothetical protein
LAQQNGALLGGARLAHDRSATDRFALAGRRLGIGVGLEIGGRERFRVPAVSVERQQQRGPLLHDPHSGMGMSVDAPLVAFGIAEPALQVEVVLGEIQEVAPREQARGEILHHPSHVLSEGIPIPQEPALDLLEPVSPLFRVTALRIQSGFDRANVLDVSANFRLLLGDPGHSSINAPSEPVELLVRGPPF